MRIEKNREKTGGCWQMMIPILDDFFNTCLRLIWNGLNCVAGAVERAPWVDQDLSAPVGGLNQVMRFRRDVKNRYHVADEVTVGTLMNVGSERWLGES
jgi:hypothetical protein